jgi:hypothetical protein
LEIKETIQQVAARGNYSFAIGEKGTTFNWGHLPRGIGLEPSETLHDIPTKNNQLQKFGFKRIFMTRDSMYGLGKSVELTFEIEDNDETVLDARNRHTTSVISPIIHIVAHAVPVYDGRLISSTADLEKLLSDLQNEPVKLINDFDLPWIECKGKTYPKYKRKA